MHFLYHDSYFKRKVQSVLNYDSWANMLVKDRKLATAGLGQVKKCACVCVCNLYNNKLFYNVFSEKPEFQMCIVPKVTSLLWT